MITKYKTWIDDENLNPVLTAIGYIYDYKFDADDWDAASFGIKNVDEIKNL